MRSFVPNFAMFMVALWAVRAADGATPPTANATAVSASVDANVNTVWRYRIVVPGFVTEGKEIAPFDQGEMFIDIKSRRFVYRFLSGNVLRYRAIHSKADDRADNVPMAGAAGFDGKAFWAAQFNEVLYSQILYGQPDVVVRTNKAIRIHTFQDEQALRAIPKLIKHAKSDEAVTLDTEDRLISDNSPFYGAAPLHTLAHRIGCYRCDRASWTAAFKASSHVREQESSPLERLSKADQQFIAAKVGNPKTFEFTPKKQPGEDKLSSEQRFLKNGTRQYTVVLDDEVAPIRACAVESRAGSDGPSAFPVERSFYIIRDKAIDKPADAQSIFSDDQYRDAKIDERRTRK